MASPIELVLPDVIVHILEFGVTLPERLKLAQCSHALDTLITTACPELWKEIDLSNNGNEITDHMLARLLERVNARAVTKSLDLSSCRGITGASLEPLRDSKFSSTLSFLRTNSIEW